jgi:hypothetical protein
MAELLVPESPMILSGFTSPDLRRSESSSSRSHTPPRFLTDPSPATLAPLLQQAQAESESCKGKGNDLRTRVILRHALRWAVERMDVDLIAWLVSLDGVFVSNIGSSPTIRDTRLTTRLSCSMKKHQASKTRTAGEYWAWLSKTVVADRNKKKACACW